MMLANCAMMNVPPSEANKLSLWEYEALLHHWNEAHDADPDVDAPDPAVVIPMLERINADPRLIH
jgi:hypothetical protein